jgi:hypothetical protein
VVVQWKKEILSRVATLFEGKRGPKPAAHADEERLYEEIGRLKMELDWLKKSPDYEWGDANGLDRPESGTIAVAAMRADWGGASDILRTAGTGRRQRDRPAAVPTDR